MTKRIHPEIAKGALTLEALRVFCAVVEESSFREAAQRLNRSQPAVSQQLKGLETKLGYALLDRKSGRPTPAGEKLYQRARSLLTEVDGLTRELADFDDTHVPVLRVGASDTTALYILPPVVKAFASAANKTRLELVSRPTEAIIDKVLRGNLDLALVTLPVADSALEVRELLRQELALITPAGHTLARKSSVTLEDLRETPLLLLDEHTRTGALLRTHFRVSGFEPRVVLDSGSFEVIKRYVSEGIGLAFLPRHSVTAADRNLRSVYVDGLPTVPLGAVRRNGAFCSRAETAFMNLLVKTVPN
ncbi:MAG: putative hydrogen peroxide-inducible genes activator [Candidatus Hydrogenedentota bacterium]